MEKIKLEVAGIPAVLYGKRSRKVYLYVHGKNGSAAEAARFASIACPVGWQVLAVDLPEHGTRKNSPEKLVPWVVTRELQAVYARMQPVWKHIRVYGVSIGAWFAMQALQTQTPEKALLVSPVVDMEKLILDLMQQAGVTEEQLRAGASAALEGAHTGALCRCGPPYRAHRYGAVPAAEWGASDYSGGRGTLVPHRDSAGRSAKLGGTQLLNLTEQKATLGELELLVAVRCRVLRAANQLPEDTPLPEVESQTRTYYQKAFAENTHTAYLLWDGETLAGTGAVSYFQVMPTVHNPTGRKAYLMNLYTAPLYRRQGIATRILTRLVEDAHRRGVTAISLEATAMGRPLYEKFGFVPMEHEMELPE